MTDEHLEIEIVPGDHEDLVVVRGELDSDTAPVLQKALVGATSSRLAFDLADLTFIDSSGLSLLLDRRRQQRAVDGDVRIVRASKPVERILDLTGTADLFEGD